MTCPDDTSELEVADFEFEIVDPHPWVEWAAILMLFAFVAYLAVRVGQSYL